MSIKKINVGAVQNDGTGDPLRDAFAKVNENFAELESSVGSVSAANAAALRDRATHTGQQAIGTVAGLQSALDAKVDKVAGKGLSTEDYTTSEKNKLAGVAAGAQVNTVTSVAGKTGAVALAKADVGLTNVDNTSDANKPISTATQAALNGKQASLGFTPVQQGGATGQGSNKVFIGWATDDSGLLCQVDGTNFGKTWPISITGWATSTVQQTVGVSAVRQTGDIGAGFAAWSTDTAVPAMQVDAQRADAAYMLWRATRWGGRHIAAMHVYEGNMSVSMSVGNERNFVWDSHGNFGAAGNIIAYSDIRLKTDITKITDALSKVSSLSGYTYTRKDTGQRQTGVVAQELQKVLPEAVVDNGEHLAVAYGNIVGLLIEAIKELKSEVDQLKGK